MKKEYTFCILSILLLLLGTIFSISGICLKTLPFSSKSALLIFAFSFVIVGCVLFAVHYKRYHLAKNLVTYNIPVIAKWTYPPNDSKIILTLIKEQKTNTLATAILILILSLIFCIIFAYSGGTYILCLGYTFAILSIFAFIIATRFISTYYDCMASQENMIIFGEEYIYFLNEIYSLNQVFYHFCDVNISLGEENILTFDFGLNDVETSVAHQIVVPIPYQKLHVALRLKDYYHSVIHLQNDE